MPKKAGSNQRILHAGLFISALLFVIYYLYLSFLEVHGLDLDGSRRNIGLFKTVDA